MHTFLDICAMLLGVFIKFTNFNFVRILSWIMQFWRTETWASVVLSVTIQKKCFSPLNTNFSGRRHFGSLFINEEQKRFGPSRIWYFVSHASHVDDVTDTDCCAQTARTRGHASVTFTRWCWGKRTRNRVKSCCVSIVYSNPVNGTPDAFIGLFPFTHRQKGTCIDYN